MEHSLSIPIIDLFAGPGGLNEGFSSLIDGCYPFRTSLSIERDYSAHKTLELRAFYRFFKRSEGVVPREYYEYISGDLTISREYLWSRYPEAAKVASCEALRAELGDERSEPFKEQAEGLIDQKIVESLKGSKHWLLIGGPPCQAYSLVGRSRSLGGLQKQHGLEEGTIRFDQDARQRLYRSYLRIIAMHAPSIFVMENVKGILSAKVDGEQIFPKILQDLSTPFESIKAYGWETPHKYEYHIVSFVTGQKPDNKHFNKYLIKSEEYGVPQARHRVILLGIRHDIWSKIKGKVKFLTPVLKKTTVKDVILDMPPLRSGFSKRHDTLLEWQIFLGHISVQDFFKDVSDDVRAQISRLNKIIKYSSLELTTSEPYQCNHAMLDGWYTDMYLTHYLNHESRTHMDSDLYRYYFASIFGQIYKKTPQLKDFPLGLLPNHKNVLKENRAQAQKFSDRFKVQLWDMPASTITSHIAKDGHYFIHPDPTQCRSLSVREAARLQTFPDNYFFEGNRTQQYHQVGNAVPPYLAKLLAEIVYDIFKRID